MSETSRRPGADPLRAADRQAVLVLAGLVLAWVGVDSISLLTEHHRRGTEPPIGVPWINELTSKETRPTCTGDAIIAMSNADRIPARCRFRPRLRET